MPEPEDTGALPAEQGLPQDGPTPSVAWEAGPSSAALALDWGGRFYALVEIVLCTGILTSQAVLVVFIGVGVDSSRILSQPKLMAAFVLLESVFLLALIVFLQRLRSESVWDLGFAARSYWREVRVGLIVVPALFVLVFLVDFFFRHFLVQWHSEGNPLLELIESPGDLALFLVASLFAGGIKEEVQRAFIIQRFGKYFSAAVVGLFLWSLAFGAGHVLQGYDSACGAAIFGMVFGALYLRRRSLVAPIVAHASYDVCVLTAYWFFGLR